MLIFFKKMSNREESIQIIEFLGKGADWKSWSEKFFSCGEHKVYEKTLVSSGSRSGLSKIPMQKEYENALKSDMDLSKKSLN